MEKETPRSACEEFTRSLLDSPSTYRLVEVSQWEEPLTGDGMAAVRDRQPLIGDGVPGLLYVGVEFDAMNEMGATQRGSNVCNFSMKDGKVIGSEVEDLVKASEHVRALMKEGRTGKDLDRTRVVEGKRGSVSVDYGGG